MAYEFYVAVGLGQDFRFGTMDKYWDDDFTNESVERVTVKDAEAAIKWRGAYRAYMSAAWTPNQTSEDRAENAKIIAEAQATMQQLEAEAEA